MDVGVYVANFPQLLVTLYYDYVQCQDAAFTLFLASSQGAMARVIASWPTEMLPKRAQRRTDQMIRPCEVHTGDGIKCQANFKTVETDKLLL